MRNVCPSERIPVQEKIQKNEKFKPTTSAPSSGKGNDTKEQRGPKIPIPTNYRKAVKYVRIAVEEKRNIQPLIEKDKHFRVGRTLVGRVLSNMPVIEAIYKQLELASKEPRLNEWLAKVLISELLFGSGRLVGNSLPVECMMRYEAQLRTALTDIEAKKSPAGNVKEPRFVRINTNLLNVEGAKRLLAEEQWNLVEETFTDYRSFLERVKKLGDAEYMQDYHFPDMLVFPHSAKSYWARAQHLSDKFVLQNKACLLPTYLLKPPKKSVVLDMCSAPGLKTTHLACLMKNKGRIYAVEYDRARYALLCEYARGFGVIKTIQSDCLEVTDEQVPGVQYVLLDPSCSGSGMLQRQMVPEPIDEDRLYKLAGLQYKLLSHAMNAFPHVRRIVYSTCSVHEMENEGVVQGVLRHNGHFRLLDARKELGKEWLNVGSPEYAGIGERCLYAKTVDDLTIGMFAAVFERCPEGVVNEVYVAYEKQKHSYDVVAQKMSRQKKREGQNGQSEDTPAQHEVQEKSSSKKRKKNRE
uniref:SAM-dependent MTase RsmB/NOP-type domain-containing protein n=1 Tax=Anopheles minimus TaxID=112268 RepID=A0A182WQS0_9DIPT